MLYVSQFTRAPVWAAISYLSSNVTLMFLNFYWFYKMIGAVRKRFVPAKESKKQHEPVTEAGVDLSAVASGINEKQQPQRRKI